MAGILISMSTLKTSVRMGVAVVATGFGIYEAKQRSRAEAVAAEARDESERLRMQLNAAQRLAAGSEHARSRRRSSVVRASELPAGYFPTRPFPGAHSRWVLIPGRVRKADCL